jgi:fatty acid synthase subunit alpha
MTYEEVTLRMVRSMFVEEEERWIDLSLRNLTGDWLRRVEERFAGVNGGGAKALALQSFASLDNFVQGLLREMPSIEHSASRL